MSGGRGLIKNLIFAYVGWKIILMVVTHSIDSSSLFVYGLIIFGWSVWWLLEMVGIIPKS